MRIKSKLCIVAVFSCCAVMSMGFANWVITQQGPLYDSLAGGIEAEHVYFSDEYLFIADENKDVSPLVYTPDGFALLDKEGKVSKTSYEGTMSVIITADLEKCARLSGGEALGISVSLRLTGTENFSPLASVRGVSCADRAHISNVRGQLAEEGDVYWASFSLDPSAGDPSGAGRASFTLEYTFVSTQADYTRDIYEVFYDSQNGQERGAEFSFGIAIRS